MTGLGVLHRTLGFVHGEVQPEHVVLGEDGVGRLIPVVRAHWVRGEQRAPERLYYLAPEKLLGDRVDARADVFSVGVLLWEALAGQRLLEAHDVDDIIARLMGGGIPRVHAPEAEAWTEPLAAIAERAIAVDPGRRFATIAEMKDVLQACCSRYLASPPGMAELFQNPQKRARGQVRDSIPPESQRLTLPPDPPAAGPTQPPSSGARDAMLEAAATRLSLASYSAVDLEEETTTHPLAAPVPVVSRAKHIQTLLGVPPPFLERESSSDAITQPFARIPASAPVIITPLPIPKPAGSRPQPGRSLTPAGPPAHLIDVRSAPPPPVSPPVESRRALSLSPFVTAEPSVAPPPPPEEPSFELVRPRRSRAALWLLLGAAVAVTAFAARPWLARQVAAATGAFPDNAASNVDSATTLPVSPTSSSLAIPEPSNAPPLTVGIASTPAAPSASTAPRSHNSARGEHVVIHDRLEPQVRKPLTPAPVPRRPEPPAAPTPMAPPTPPAAAPAPTPKPKPPPVSEADQYGI
jgi:eukaryotic-like serine/threonine-protein kinase